MYDAAYALYIEDPNCPKTIYEIPGRCFGLQQPPDLRRALVVMDRSIEW